MPMFDLFVSQPEIIGKGQHNGSMSEYSVTAFTIILGLGVTQTQQL